jgi:hypothetical protein
VKSGQQRGPDQQPLPERLAAELHRSDPDAAVAATPVSAGGVSASARQRSRSPTSGSRKATANASQSPSARGQQGGASSRPEPGALFRLDPAPRERKLSNLDRGMWLRNGDTVEGYPVPVPFRSDRFNRVISCPLDRPPADWAGRLGC